MIGLGQFAAWALVGLAAGSIAAVTLTWKRAGYGLWLNLLLGMAGAALGGLAFRYLDLFASLDAIALTARDLVAAIVGSFLLVAARSLWMRMRGPNS